MSAGLAACAHSPKTVCPAGGQSATAELVFARVAGDAPGPGVSEAAFAGFVNDQVVTRFHEGLTVIDAQDLKPRPGGGTIYGPAKVVMIVLPGRADDADQLAAVRAAYKARFNQQSVLIMTHQDCVSF